MQKKIKEYLHPKYKRVKERVEKINKAMAGISSETVSGTEDSSASSEQSSHDFSKESSSDDEEQDNHGYAPSEMQSKAKDPDDEISYLKTLLEVREVNIRFNQNHRLVKQEGFCLWQSMVVEIDFKTDDEKHKRMIKNPPNPCKEDGRFCTKFETREQALYHYHLYHSKIYRAHDCSQHPSCGRKFHDENDAFDHDCHGESNIVTNINNNLFIKHMFWNIFRQRKRVPLLQIKEQQEAEMIQVCTYLKSTLKFIMSSFQKYMYVFLGKIKKSSKRRPSPSLNKKAEKKHKKKTKKHRRIISDSDDDGDDDPERDNLIIQAEKKRKDDPNKDKPSTSSNQQPVKNPSSRPKNGNLESHYSQ